jgi:tetratricopeptide (TPR) repeat protein
MNKPTAQFTLILTALVPFVWGIPSFAADPNSNGTANRGNISSTKIPETKKATVKGDADTLDSSVLSLSRKEEDSLTEFQKQARLYRAQGLQFQNLGNLEAATGFYQKAIQLDPNYVAPYNDLGVIFEAQGFVDRAEQCYLQAIRADPNYTGAYSNLALLYENERELDKAAFYWGKRAELGSPDDPWTLKARQRVADIRAISSNRPLQDMREQEIVDLMTDVSAYKNTLRKDDKALAASYVRKAKLMEQKGDEITALKLAVDAKQLDPANEDIQKYVDKLQVRVLSK